MLDELENGELSGRLSIDLTSLTNFTEKFSVSVMDKSQALDQEVMRILRWVHTGEDSDSVSQPYFQNKIYQTLLFSEANRGFQLSHLDYHRGQMDKAYSLFYSIEGMTLILFPSSHVLVSSSEGSAHVDLLYPLRLYVPPAHYLIIDAGMVHSGCTYPEPNIRLHWFAYNPSLGKSRYGSFEPDGESLNLMAPKWLVKRRQQCMRGSKESREEKMRALSKKRASIALARTARKVSRTDL